jgi:VTC domain
MSIGSDRFPAALSALEPATLDEIDRRSALRHRVDTKYVVLRERLPELIAQVDGYDVLEIDGRRVFGYENVYFDTPDLRCFHDHVEGARPRFKARTRYYRDTSTCLFEVKLKSGDDTTKRQRDCDITDHGVLTESARAFLRDALTDLTGEEPPEDLAATLSTSFRRATLSAREGGERATIDLEVVLRAMDDRSVTLRDDYALMETKSERGEGQLDAALVAAGCEPASISKYRLGVGLLLADDPESAHNQSLRSCFS